MGLVWIGLADDAEGSFAEKLDLSAWARSRTAIRERSANRAFDLYCGVIWKREPERKTKLKKSLAGYYFGVVHLSQLTARRGGDPDRRTE